MLRQLTNEDRDTIICCLKASHSTKLLSDINAATLRLEGLATVSGIDGATVTKALDQIDQLYRQAFN